MIQPQKLPIRFIGLGLAVILCLCLVQGYISSASAQGPQPGGPEVLQLIGPVSMDKDLRDLPSVPHNGTPYTGRPLPRYPRAQTQITAQATAPDALAAPLQAPQPNMPVPSLTFGGVTFATSGCGCLPPDTDGDVGPTHYIQTVNSSFQVFTKTTGATLAGPTTYNSLFSAMGPTTPCGNGMNDGDAVVFYDHIADRWVISDFAFAALPGPPPFYQCFAVSKTGDPVSGGWWLYALQHDPSNPTWVGDYPKMGLWPDGYYMSANMFDGTTLAFQGVRVYALDRSKLINGTGAPAPSVVAFTVLPAGLGQSYSLLPSTFRYGAPPAGRDEFFAAVDSPATAGAVLNTVHVWKFHVDFTTPALSTFGVGASHTPNTDVTVNNFVDAFTATTSNLVPQTGTTARLDTLGDKLMANLWYQNLFGFESLWATQTISGTSHTDIRWYQFNVSGGTIAATPVQQQTFDNGNDGLHRWMPSGAVDNAGNFSVGYSASSSSINPAIRYAGRLRTDAVNTLAQGEATLIAGGGHQTSSSGRWGDYSSMTPDPVTPCAFWYTQEYYSATSSASWNTRIGTFAFAPAQCNTPTVVDVVTASAQTEDTSSVFALAFGGLALVALAGLVFVARRRA